MFSAFREKFSNAVAKQKRSVPEGPRLTDTEYTEKYYEEHRDAGLDYLICGYWQLSYARMVTEAALQPETEGAFVIDAGAACGAQLHGFRETGAFSTVMGVEINSHMVDLGQKHFAYSPDQLLVGDLTALPVQDGTVTLVHSHQVLEHIPDDMTDPILAEFFRVLRPGGRAFFVLDSIKHGQEKHIYMEDPTHVNIQPTLYWSNKFAAHGFLFDVETYNRCWTSQHGPTQGLNENFFQHYPYWSAWALIKPEA